MTVLYNDEIVPLTGCGFDNKCSISEFLSFISLNRFYADSEVSQWCKNKFLTAAEKEEEGEVTQEII